MIGEIVYLDNFDLLVGKVMDNCVGVCVLEYIVKELENVDLGVDLYLVGIV